jgi:hypothetical protein
MNILEYFEIQRKDIHTLVVWTRGRPKPAFLSAGDSMQIVSEDCHEAAIITVVEDGGDVNWTTKVVPIEDLVLHAEFIR